MKEVGEQRPFVDLSFARMFCGIHGEPFREKWPRGAMLFQVRALESIFADDAFWDEIERKTGVRSTPETPVDKEHIEAAFDHKPVCCRLGGEKLLDTYEWQHGAGGIGAKGFCHNPACGRFALGAAFLQSVPGNSTQRIPHVCFRCIAMFVIPRNS